jgi:hypothetical protein
MISGIDSIQAIIEPQTRFTPEVEVRSIITYPIAPRAAPADMLPKFRLTTSSMETSLRSPDAFLTNAVGWLVMLLAAVHCEFNIFALMFMHGNETK